LVEAAAIAEIVVWRGSNRTVAVFDSKSTSTEETPSTLLMAFLTVIGHVAQVMFSIANV